MANIRIPLNSTYCSSIYFMTEQIQEDDEQEPQISKKLNVMQRRENVWTMLRMGMSQEKIAERLDVSVKTISRDYQELKNEAVEWMNTLPEGELQIHYKKSIEDVESIIRELWRIWNNTKDESMKVKILAQIADKTKMNLEMIFGKKVLDVRSHIQTELRGKKVHGKYPSQF